MYSNTINKATSLLQSQIGRFDTHEAGTQYLEKLRRIKYYETPMPYQN